MGACCMGGAVWAACLLLIAFLGLKLRVCNMAGQFGLAT